MERRRIAIVGGGLAGLSVAAHLRVMDPTLQLVVFEASQRVGGVIDTERIGDFLIDHGADMFATQPPAAMNLIRELGGADRLIEPNVHGRGAMIVCGGRLVSVPEGFVLMRATKLASMLTTPLLSPQGKLRLLAERFVSRRHEEADESVGSFVRRRLGRETLDRIVAPLVSGIYTADVERLSMQATMGKIAQMERDFGSLAKATRSRSRSGQDSAERTSSGARYNQFRSFPGGMIELINLLADSLPSGALQTATAVESIRREADGWRVAGEDRFDHVVIATPAKVSARLLSDLAPDAAALLASIESASSAIVTLAVKRSSIRRPVSTFGFVVPLIENRRILACSFASEKFAGRAPDDHVLLRVFIGGALQPELLRGDDDALIGIAREELLQLIGLSGEPVLAKVIRWTEAMPQYHVGHLQRVAKIKRAVSALPGISLVGSALDGVGVGPIIASAEEVAQKIVRERTGPAEESSQDPVDAKAN